MCNTQNSDDQFNTHWGIEILNWEKKPWYRIGIVWYSELLVSDRFWKSGIEPPLEKVAVFNAEVLNSSPRAPPLCIFCMSLFVNTPDSDNQLVRSALHAWTVFRLTCSLHTGSIAPYSLSRGNPLKFTLFQNIHSWICAAQRFHARKSVSVTSYTSVNIYNFNSRLAHFNALWMEYIRSLRTGIMAEYPVMSTSQGTYVRIEQTSEEMRVTYEICRAGGGARTGIENRCFNGFNGWFILQRLCLWDILEIKVVVFFLFSPDSLATKLSYLPFRTSTSQNKNIKNKQDYQSHSLDLNVFIFLHIYY